MEELIACKKAVGKVVPRAPNVRSFSLVSFTLFYYLTDIKLLILLVKMCSQHNIVSVTIFKLDPSFLMPIVLCNLSLFDVIFTCIRPSVPTVIGDFASIGRDNWLEYATTGKRVQ